MDMKAFAVFSALLMLGFVGLAHAQDGSIVAWGYNGQGQCDVPSPNTGFVAVDGGFLHSLGVKANGSIMAWGWNYYGECTVPSPNTSFVAVAGGGYHSLGLKSDGSIVAWGDNTLGQCDVPSPNASFVAVAAGYYHSLGLKEDGSIVAWGRNIEGQCDVPSPNAGFAAVAAGSYHSLGLKTDDSIVAWGDNEFGQCTVPSPNTGFVAVAGGYAHNLGLRYGTDIEDAMSAPIQGCLSAITVYPNPFSGMASVVFQSPGLSSATLEVYDVSGRLVKSQELGAVSEGQQTILWDGSSSNGETLANEVYMIRLVGGSGSFATARVILLR
jgi:hypothetical protein